MIYSRRTVLALSAAFIAVGRRARGEPISIGGKGFGTAWRATLNSSDATHGREIIEYTIELLDRQISPWRKDSDLCQLNAAPGGRWIATPRSLRDLIRAGHEASHRTEGGFNHQVGPQARRFGFGRIDGVAAYGQFTVRGERVKKNRKGLTVDPCGHGKGYAVDRIIAALDAAGIRDVLFDFGGELRGVGRHPTGRDWRLAVEAPGGGRALGIVEPKGMAVATSAHHGHADAAPVSHIINPRTGRPATQTLAQVTVLARKAVDADALATGLLALGKVRGLEVARRSKLAALFVEPVAGGFSVDTTGDLQRYLVG